MMPVVKVLPSCVHAVRLKTPSTAFSVNGTLAPIIPPMKPTRANKLRFQKDTAPHPS